MKQISVIAVMLIPLILYTPRPAQAFECPKYFAEAQTTIDKASASIRRMRGGMALASRAQLQQAKMSIVEAKYHHTISGNYHHASSIVRAHEAIGYAKTAYILSQLKAKQ